MVGFVLSTVTCAEALPVLPARSLHEPVTVIAEPSPDDVVLVVHALVSMPEPPELSAQFQLTVTSVLFQPSALASGDCVGLADGAALSSVTVPLTDRVVLFPARSVQVADWVYVSPGAKLPSVVDVHAEVSTPDEPKSNQLHDVRTFTVLALTNVCVVDVVWSAGPVLSIGTFSEPMA